MGIANPDRWAVSLLSILGALGLAGWSVYWDLRRRLPGHRPAVSQVQPASRENPASHDRHLAGAVGMLASAWLMHYLSDRLGGWLALAGYCAFVAGIALLAVHVGRRLSASPHNPGDG